MPPFRLFTFIRPNTLVSSKHIQPALAYCSLRRLKLATAECCGCGSFTAPATGQAAIPDHLFALKARQPSDLPFTSYTMSHILHTIKGESDHTIKVPRTFEFGEHCCATSQYAQQGLGGPRIIARHSGRKI